MKILINYATVSGNSAMLSQQLYDKLKAAHADFDFVYKDADDCKDEDYGQYDLVLFVSSSWDDGDLNMIAEDYLNQLPDLAGQKFALIGLGDSSYEHFCGGVEKVEAKIKEKGGKIVGSTHKIDGFIEDPIVEEAYKWSAGIISGLK